jgi:hypothetical protein
MKIEKLTLRELGLIATIFAILVVAALWMAHAIPAQTGEKRGDQTTAKPSAVKPNRE